MDTYVFNAGATFATAADMPEDATDLRDASTVRTPLEAIGDNTAILAGRFGSQTGWKRLFSVHEADYDGTYWDLLSAKLVSKASSTGKPIIWRLTVPNGATLTLLRVLFKGSPGHPTGPDVFPASRCQFTLAWQDFGTSLTTVNTTVDTAANIATYETAHQVSSPALSEVINMSAGSSPRLYTVTFSNEAGAGAIAAGTEVYVLEATYTLANAARGV